MKHGNERLGCSQSFVIWREKFHNKEIGFKFANPIPQIRCSKFFFYRYSGSQWKFVSIYKMGKLLTYCHLVVFSEWGPHWTVHQLSGTLEICLWGFSNISCVYFCVLQDLYIVMQLLTLFYDLFLSAVPGAKIVFLPFQVLKFKIWSPNFFFVPR